MANKTQIILTIKCQKEYSKEMIYIKIKESSTTNQLGMGKSIINQKDNNQQIN